MFARRSEAHSPVRRARVKICAAAIRALSDLATIYLIRHAEAAAHWAEAEDAELSAVGNQQAAALAQTLASRGPLPIFSSPLRRARATATPLETLWQTAARIESAVAEIPTQGVAHADRSAWLNGLMQNGWSGADRSSQQWRRGVLDFVLGLKSDAVIFTHFVAINTVVGAALEHDAVYLFRPQNVSITVVENGNGRLRLIERGAGEAIVR